MTQSLELLLDDDLDAIVRAQWSALAEADLPSQARHTGESNRPHVTLCVADAVPAYLETAVKAALTGRLPVPLRLGGLLCFPQKGDRLVLSRVVVPNVDLLELQATCSDLWVKLPGAGPTTSPGGWTAHVTLARNLPAARFGEAVAALTGHRGEAGGRAVAVRRWNSDTRTEWRVG